MNATLEDYKKRLNNVFGDIFSTYLKEENLDIGDLIRINDWVSECNNGGFIDYDGHGNFCFARGDGKWVSSSVNVYPSDITKLKIEIPKWATHVLWFNR